MSFAYIRAAYLVPAKRFARVRVTEPGAPGRLGTAVGARDEFLRVRFDDSPDEIETVHPTLGVDYLK